MKDEKMKIILKKFKSIICISLLFFAVIFSFAALEYNDRDETLIRNIVDEFCKAEFMGQQDIRFDLAKFTPEREEIEKRRDSQFKGFVKTWDIDPVVIVASYRITNITLLDGKASAIVVYERLAKTEGDFDKRKIVKDYRKEDALEISLIFQDNKWWILDPPTPRISREAIINYYQQHLNRTKNLLILPDTSDAQKNKYYRMKEDLKILENLR